MMPDMSKFTNNFDELSLQDSRDVDNRMCGNKIINTITDYVMKENIPIREALGIKDPVTSINTMVRKEALKNEIKYICGAGASYDEVVKALEYFH